MMVALAKNVQSRAEEYSPGRFGPQFFLAGAVSIFVHGLVLAIFWFAFILVFQRDSDILKPPSMDAVMVEGLGDGAGGFGGLPGLPGDPKTEFAQTKEKAEFKDPSLTKLTLPSPPDQILSPTPAYGPTDPTDLLKELDLINKDAEKDAKKSEPNAKEDKQVVKVNMPGVGQGGQGGSGNGGNGLGGGGTKPGIKGRSLTKQEIHAYRWRFNLGTDPTAAKEHVDKLIAGGFIILVTDARGNYYFIKDLQRRPVELEKKGLGPLRDAFKLFNQNAESKKHLARELRLPFEPESVIMFLSKERENQLANEEARFARSQGRDPRQIRETLFDFVLQDGVYEPRAIKQN